MSTRESFYSPPGSDVVPSAEQSELHALLAAFAGEKADYYLEKWRPMLETGSRVSWNWAAFFLQYYWLAYRRMIRELFILIGVGTALFIAGAVAAVVAIGGDASAEVSDGAAIAFLVGVLGFVVALFLGYGMLGNYLYLRKGLRVVEAARTQPAPLEAAAAKGGTRWLGVGILLALNLLSSILNALTATVQ